jgi:phosphoribosylaminoimidazole-succinocarboxamide synthase
MDRATLASALPRAYPGLPEEATAGRKVYRGKVRDVVEGESRMLLVASDRISAFDRVLSTVPFKGEILTRVSDFWFKHTSDIVPSHLIPSPELGGRDPVAETGRAALVRRAEMVPVEVVVRGFLTGSAWRDYEAGRPVSGIRLPAGLAQDSEFPEPLITPSTKEASGHDRPMSGAEIVRSGRVDADLWNEIERAAKALYLRGRELSKRNGLVLVDTKYEFGIVDGRLVVADEMHTPDSSRYWRVPADPAYTGPKQELDKEGFRRWLMERGFSGEGQAPEITDEVRIVTAARYVEAYEAITGEKFEPVRLSAQARDEAIAEWVKAVR